jgi:hypothetical protein
MPAALAIRMVPVVPGLAPRRNAPIVIISVREVTDGLAATMASAQRGHISCTASTPSEVGEPFSVASSMRISFRPAQAKIIEWVFEANYLQPGR